MESTVEKPCSRYKKMEMDGDLGPVSVGKHEQIWTRSNEHRTRMSPSYFYLRLRVPKPLMQLLSSDVHNGMPTRLRRCRRHSGALKDH